MKFKYLLQLGIVLSLMITTILAIWFYSININQKETVRLTNKSHDISNAIFKLNSITSDYLLFYQERAAHQRGKIYLTLNKLLNENNLIQATTFNYLDKLNSLNTKAQHLFEKLLVIRNEELTNKSSSPLINSQKKALASQLLNTTQLMSVLSKKFYDSIEHKIKDNQKQIYFLASTILSVFFVTLFLIWYFIASRIVIPVDRLKNHIKKIDAEHLGNKYHFKHNDEIGELVNSFNHMADNLFNTTVSKHHLLNEIDGRIKSENELNKQIILNAKVLESSSNIILILDTHGCFVQFNHYAEKVSGYKQTELIGKPIWEHLIPTQECEDVKKLFNPLKEDDTKIVGNHENHWVTKEGNSLLIEWHNDVIRDSTGVITHIVSTGHDITQKREKEIEEKQDERELNQSRKMEALGQLTGGIAHDFNNMLGIILGYTELALELSILEKNSKFINYLENVQTASNRAKALISKMLVFSRVEQTRSRPSKLLALLDENINMMRSILPSTININISTENDLPNVFIDPIQFQQIIMNLMINAKDAMDSVGEIKVSLTKFKNQDQDYECSSCHKKSWGIGLS